MLLQDKSDGFVVLKTYFSIHYVQNCGGEKKSKFRISIFCAKNAQTGRGLANLHVFQVIYLIFLMSEKEVDEN
jgi:hypothetical protein